MNLKKIILTLTASALAVLGLAAIGGLVLYRTASAQTSTPSATVMWSRGFGGHGFGGGFGRHGRGGGLPGIPAPSAPETTPSGDL